MTEKYTAEEIEEILPVFYQFLQSLTTIYAWEKNALPLFKEESKVTEATKLAIKRSVIHSTIIGIRALNEFFEDGRGRPDDLKANRFEVTDQYSAFLSDDENKTMHKRIAHITELGRDNDTYPWDIFEYILRGLAIAKKFLKDIQVQESFPKQLEDENISRLATLSRFIVLIEKQSRIR